MTVTYPPKIDADYIGDNTALKRVCDEFAQAPWLAIDTEFLRERTYYAKLCLIQIAAPERIICIDPLAIQDLQPLARLFATKQTKILHAARQDLEVIWQRLGLLPGVLFDTQLAAGFCGYGDQVSYAALVSDLEGIDLPKDHTRTDWSRRPLSIEQIGYARSDVEYLPALYGFYCTRLEQLGRGAWFEAECRALLDPELYQQAPALAWQRLKGGASLRPASQQAAKRLAAWREARAQSRDIPREWVLPSSQLLQIARLLPQDIAELQDIKELHPKLVERAGKQLLEQVAINSEVAPEPVWDDSEPLNGTQKRLLRHLMTLLKEQAEHAGIAPALIANRKTVERLLRGERESPLTQSWRLELVGADMLQAIQAEQQ